MDQAPQDTRLGQPRKRPARLAQLDALALHWTDPEPPPLQAVEVDAPRRDVASRFSGSELDPMLGGETIQCLDGDQRELLIALGLDTLSRVEVVLALEPAPRHCADAFHRLGKDLVLG